MNRRQFLTRAGTFSAGLYFGGGMLRGNRVVGANEKLNVGVIGIGGQGTGNLQRILGLEENVVAICDVDANNLSRAAGMAKNAKKYTDYRELIETHAGLDAVVISTPDHHHAPATVRAIRKGLHVYCEKPLTHTVAEARLIAQEAAKAKVATQMGTHNHAHPGYLRTVELLQGGALGDVGEIHIITDRPGSFWKQGQKLPSETPPVPANLNWDNWLGPAPQRAYHPSLAHFAWRGWWDYGTGAIGDMAIHLMDVSYWALDLRGPCTVTSKGSEPVMPASGPTWMISTFEFPARGKFAPVKVVWYEGEAKVPDYVNRWLPMNGSLFISADKKRMLSIKHDYMPHLIFADTRYDYTAPKPHLPPSPGHHKQWTMACRGQAETGSNFGYAGPFTEVVLLGNVAYRSGKKLLWNPEKMTTGDAEADALLTKRYRAGWGVE